MKSTASLTVALLATWNKQDPMQIVPAALKEGIGLYGFTKPGADSLLPLEAMLARRNFGGHSELGFFGSDVE
jgi:hypothetical protein